MGDDLGFGIFAQQIPVELRSWTRGPDSALVVRVSGQWVMRLDEEVMDFTDRIMHDIETAFIEAETQTRNAGGRVTRAR